MTVVTARSAPVVRRPVDAAFLDAVRERVGDSSGGLSPDVLAGVVEATARATGSVLGRRGLADLTRAVHDELVGAGPLQPLLDDPEVTDVLVNGPSEVWVERAGRLVRTPVTLGGPGDVRALAVRLAARGGQRLDDAVPTVDARLPDGTRLHAVLPPVADGCTVLSLRVVRSRAYTLEELVAAGAVPAASLPLLRALVQERLNLLVSGATGAGKTTLLAALLATVPADERIVLIEESGELRLPDRHLVRLVARRANVDGAGRVDLADLVRNAVRMRPDRVVLGECRGAEVRDVLAALNTGHAGCCATVHANAAADVPARLEALATLAGMSGSALAAQAASAFDVVLHLRRVPAEGRRYLAEIGWVTRGPTGSLVVEPAVVLDEDGRGRLGPAWPVLARRLGRPEEAPGGADGAWVPWREHP